MKGIGTEWLIEASGCDADALRSIPRLQRLFNSLIAELNLNPLGDAAWHQFPETGGVTGFVLLTESHLACHTWPELGAFALDLFCCNPACPPWPWQEQLREVMFGIAFWLITRLAPFSIRKELEQDHNTSIAIVIAAVIIGIAIIVASAIHG